MAVVPAKDRMREFFDRRHPGYYRLSSHWYFLELCYEGGRAWFNENIWPYHKEGAEEYGARVARAYRFNHTREVVDLVQKYLFKGTIARSDNAPDVVKTFWKKSTLAGLNIDQLIRAGATGNSIGGRVAIVVDSNLKATTKGKVSVAEAKKQKSRIYAYLVKTRDILDYAYDEDGDGGLLWIKLREHTRDDADPLRSTGDVLQRVRLWTRTGWSLYEEIAVNATKSRDAQMVVREIDSGEHSVGIVPVVLFDHMQVDSPYSPPGLIDDIAYLDKAATNYLSNLDAIIQDQTFSQLAMPAQNLMPGDDVYNKVLELGTKRVFVYDPGTGSGAKPEYLSPDPKQAGVIVGVISKIINEIYHTIGLAGERTKEDNSKGIDNSSGVAKAYDFDRVTALLLSKAGSCQTVENRIVELVCLWNGDTVPAEDLVTYPTTFDVMTMVDELLTATSLSQIQAPPEVRREQMRSLVDKMFPRLADDIKKKIRADIDVWLTEADIQFNPPTKFNTDPAVKPSQQGQQSKTTK